MSEKPTGDTEPEPKEPPDTSWVTEVDVRHGDRSGHEYKADSQDQ